MSSILFDKLPSAVTVAGRELAVNTDFRCMARFENDMLKVRGNNPKERARIIEAALKAFYIYGIPSDIEEAIRQMWWFYRCGEEITSRKNQTGTTKRNIRLYDYEIDGQRIVSAFQSQYGIDLTNTELHWWLFKGYFADLNDSCDFVKIMCYRGIDLKDIKGKREKERYRKLQMQYALPELKTAPMTKEERDMAFKAKLLGR